MPRLLERIARVAPHVNIHTVQVPSGRLRDLALESGEVDLAAGYFENFDGSFRQQLLFEESYVGMVRRGHPTIGDTLTLETFLATPQLVYQPTGGGHGLQESAVHHAFAAADVPHRVAMRAAHSMGMTSIVSNTDLLVIVPSRLPRACSELADVRILALRSTSRSSRSSSTGTSASITIGQPLAARPGRRALPGSPRPRAGLGSEHKRFWLHWPVWKPQTAAEGS